MKIQDRIKYFDEPIFCEVFISSLRLSELFYKYDLYAFVVLNDHAHLLFYPHEVKDLSRIIQYLKRHITRNINFIMSFGCRVNTKNILIKLDRQTN